MVKFDLRKNGRWFCFRKPHPKPSPLISGAVLLCVRYFFSLSFSHEMMLLLLPGMSMFAGESYRGGISGFCSEFIEVVIFSTFACLHHFRLKRGG